MLEGQGFRGGSDKKMKRMWLRLEMVAADLPTPRVSIYIFLSINIFLSI